MNQPFIPILISLFEIVDNHDKYCTEKTRKDLNEALKAIYTSIEKYDVDYKKVDRFYEYQETLNFKNNDFLKKKCVTLYSIGISAI